jgi:hypothetical protein
MTKKILSNGTESTLIKMVSLPGFQSLICTVSKDLIDENDSGLEDQKVYMAVA